VKVNKIAPPDLAGQVTLEGCVEFVQIINGLGEFDDPELVEMTAHIKNNMLTYKKASKRVNASAFVSSSSSSSSASNMLDLSPYTRSSNVTGESREAYAKVRWQNVVETAARDFSRICPFHPILIPPPLAHGMSVEVLLPQSEEQQQQKQQQQQQKQEWKAATVVNYSAEVVEVELEVEDDNYDDDEESKSPILLCLPRSKVRLPSSLLSDNKRATGRAPLREKTHRRTDTRMSVEKELEEECHFKPRLFTAFSPFAVPSSTSHDNEGVPNKHRQSRARKPAPPSYPSAFALDKIIAGGGDYYPGKGFVPGPPTSSGIPLYLYDASAPPAFDVGTYLGIVSATMGGGGNGSGGSGGGGGGVLKKGNHVSGGGGRGGGESGGGGGHDTRTSPSSGMHAPISSNSIPYAPALPTWAWSAGGDPFHRDESATGGKEKKGGLSIKRSEKKEEKKSGGGGWQDVMDEMAKRISRGGGNTDLLKKVEKKEVVVGKLSTGKKGKKRRGAGDFTDVIDELSYTLARMRGDFDGEEDEDDDAEGEVSTATTSTHAATAGGGVVAAGKDKSFGKSLSALLSPPKAVVAASAAAQQAPALKPARNKATNVPQPPPLDTSKFPALPPQTPAPVPKSIGGLFGALPASINIVETYKAAVERPATRPAPPPLPLTWPPVAQMLSPLPAAITSSSKAAASSLSPPSSSSSSYLNSMPPSTRAAGGANAGETSFGSGGSGGSGGGGAGGGAGGGGKGVSFGTSLVGNSSAASGEGPTTIVTSQLQLPIGYYMHAPKEGMVIPGGILPNGLTTPELCSFHVGANARNNNDQVEKGGNGATLMNHEEASLNSSFDNGEGGLVLSDLPLPADYFGAIQRLQRAKAIRDAAREAQDKALGYRNYEVRKMITTSTVVEEFSFSKREGKKFSFRKEKLRSAEENLPIAHHLPNKKIQFNQELNLQAPDLHFVRQLRSYSPATTKTQQETTSSTSSYPLSSSSSSAPLLPLETLTKKVRSAIIESVGSSVVFEACTQGGEAALEAFGKLSGVPIRNKRILEIHVVKKSLRSLKLSELTHEEDLDRLVLSMDRNQDGVLSTQEFHSWLFSERNVVMGGDNAEPTITSLQANLQQSPAFPSSSSSSLFRTPQMVLTPRKKQTTQIEEHKFLTPEVLSKNTQARERRKKLEEEKARLELEKQKARKEKLRHMALSSYSVDHKTKHPHERILARHAANTDSPHLDTASLEEARKVYESRNANTFNAFVSQAPPSTPNLHLSSSSSTSNLHRKNTLHNSKAIFISEPINTADYHQESIVFGDSGE